MELRWCCQKKRKVGMPVRNNCPYANQEVLKIVKRLREIEEMNRKVMVYANLYTALRAGNADIPGAARAPVRCSPLNFPKQSAHYKRVQT